MQGGERGIHARLIPGGFLSQRVRQHLQTGLLFRNPPQLPEAQMADETSQLCKLSVFKKSIREETTQAKCSTGHSVASVVFLWVLFIYYYYGGIFDAVSHTVAHASLELMAALLLELSGC